MAELRILPPAAKYFKKLKDKQLNVISSINRRLILLAHWG